MKEKYVAKSKLFSHMILYGFRSHMTVTEFVDSLPVADVTEVQHGRWIKDKTQIRDDEEIYDYCCSLCENPALLGPYNNNDNLTSFCPWCGANMDLEEEAEK